MGFFIYDMGLLIIFAICISIFLYLKRKNLKKEGLFFLYKTSWGIKIINHIGEKYQKTLKFLSYISIGLGYFLMAGMIYLFGKMVWIYAFYPNIVQLVKVPPIMPLIPYLPRMFNIPGLPPFYFIYWIIILAIIAITHEFSHGIFAAYNKIKIKSTGFGFFPFFLPVLLAAFVELDEEKMAKKNKFSQMAVISSGTFANILTGLFFIVIMSIFFSFAFTPTGVVFDEYAYGVVGISSIISINNLSISDVTYEKILNTINDEGLNKIKTKEKSYVVTKSFLEKQNNNEAYVYLYHDSPAINSGLAGVISEINGIKINGKEILTNEILKYSPGEELTIKTKSEDKILEYKIILGENPYEEGFPWLGIGFIGQQKKGIMGKILDLTSLLKDSNVHYEPKFAGSLFIYNLLWWLILISISVALINMLPVGIFDGGRFLYLTVLAITKSENKAKKFFKASTYFFLFLLLVILILWALSFIK